MKIYSIAIFLLIFNISLSLLDASSAFPIEATKGKLSNTQQLNDTVRTSGSLTATGSAASSGDNFVAAIGDTIFGFANFVKIFVFAPVYVGDIIENIFGSNPPVPYYAWAIKGLLTLIYIAGAVQLLSGKSFKNFS